MSGLLRAAGRERGHERVDVREIEDAVAVDIRGGALRDERRDKGVDVGEVEDAERLGEVMAGAAILPEPSGLEVVVVGPKRGRWRAGRRFGPEETRIPVEDLSEAQKTALLDDEKKGGEDDVLSAGPAVNIYDRSNLGYLAQYYAVGLIYGGLPATVYGFFVGYLNVPAYSAAVS